MLRPERKITDLNITRKDPNAFAALLGDMLMNSLLQGY